MLIVLIWYVEGPGFQLQCPLPYKTRYVCMYTHMYILYIIRYNTCSFYCVSCENFSKNLLGFIHYLTLEAAPPPSLSGSSLQPCFLSRSDHLGSQLIAGPTSSLLR